VVIYVGCVECDVRGALGPRPSSRYLLPIDVGKLSSAIASTNTPAPPKQYQTATRLNYRIVAMKSISRAGSAALRRATRTPIRAQPPTARTVGRAAAAPFIHGRNGGSMQHTRGFQAGLAVRGLIPDAENPAPREAEDIDQPTVPTDLTTTEFHERADAYFDELVNRLEEKQEQTPDVEVEYSVRGPLIASCSS
jgi:hypothetical protein